MNHHNIDFHYVGQMIAVAGLLVAFMCLCSACSAVMPLL